jgi:cytochrome c oxidase assembly protein subunit 15
LFVLAFMHVIDAVRARVGTAVVNGALWFFAAITLQAALGILTLLNQVPIDLALTHQAVAIVVLTLALLQAERMTGSNVASETPSLRGALATKQSSLSL